MISLRGSQTSVLRSLRNQILGMLLVNKLTHYFEYISE